MGFEFRVRVQWEGLPHSLVYVKDGEIFHFPINRKTLPLHP